MKSALAGFTAVAVVLATPAFAQQAPAPVPVADLVKRVDIPYEEFRLANGLRVVVHTDRKAPIVGVSVWYDVGSKHEPKGKTGFAHLFEHLMFNGSENSPGEFFEPLKDVGATDYNGTTNPDRTNYFQTVPRAALDRALFLESDRMGYLLGAVTQAKLDEQRGVVQNEKRQGDNQPYGLFRYRLSEGLFPQGHPYYHSTIGSMADLDAASLADVKNWFRQYYGPNNAVLVLAGDIDAATARPMVEKYFGAIAKGPQNPRPAITVPTLAAAKAEVMQDRVAVTRLYRMWAVPGLDNPDSTVLDASVGVLGGLASSRLDNALVRKEKLAVGVGAFNNTMAQAGMLVLSADVRPGVDPAVVGKRMDEIVAEYLKNGPTRDELERYKTRTAASRIRGLEAVGGFGGKAVTLASGALYANDPGFYKKELARLAAVTPEQARAVTAKWLSRPVYALTIEPGKRAAYAEAAATPKAPAASAPEAEVKGTRGALPAVADVKDIDFPTVTRTKLSNGIELVYAQRDAVPVTQAIISFDAGVASDVPTALGTEGMTLTLMEEGTKTRDSIAIAEAQERLGAGISTGSNADRSYVSVQTPSPNLAGTLELAADVVRNPSFPAAELERVRAQTLARIAQIKSNPNGLALMAMPPLLYGKESPYAKTAAIGGDEAAVRALTRDDLTRYYNAWIRPEKAKIFVVSDRPLAEIRQAFEARFGDWRGTGAAGTKRFAKAQQTAPKILLVDRPDSPQSIIYAAQMTPVDPFADSIALGTASEVLGGDFLSRLNMDLREAKSWSYGVRGGVARMEHAVPFTVTAPVQADKTGPAIEAIRMQVRDYLGDRGITRTEFDRSTISAIRKMSGQYETAGAVLNAMQSNDFLRRPDDYQDGLAKKYRALTSAQVDAAAREAIDPARFIWVVVGDAAKVKPQLDSIGLPVEVVPATPAATSPKPAAK